MSALKETHAQVRTELFGHLHSLAMRATYLVLLIGALSATGSISIGGPFLFLSVAVVGGWWIGWILAAGLAVDRFMRLREIQKEISREAAPVPGDG